MKRNYYRTPMGRAHLRAVIDNMRREIANKMVAEYRRAYPQMVGGYTVVRERFYHPNNP